ncbi:MAG: RNA polymerase sigma factor [Acidobacteriota bacterium]
MADQDQGVIATGAETAREAGDLLESLVREHAQFVYQVAYSVVRNRHDAEDAAQETFIRVLRNKEQIPEIRDQRAWLARICWRVAVSRRRVVREIPVENSGAAARLRSLGATPEEMAADRQMLGLVGRLIESLPGDLRSALVLSTVQDISSAEIAYVLDIPAPSVRGRLFRARRMLREKLVAVLGGEYGR